MTSGRDGPSLTFARRRTSGSRRVLVVVCHPDPESFVAAAADRVRRGLAVNGADVRWHDLYSERFDPRFGAEEHRRHLEPGTDPSVADHAADLEWCDTLVLVYPTWWGAQPAMLKGWFDRVLARGVAWDLDARRARLRPRLHGLRSIHAVTTHGSRKAVNALQGESGKRVLGRTLRPLCARTCRVRWHACYGLDTASAEQRTAFLDRVEATFVELR